MAKRDFKLPTMSVYIEGPLIFTESRDLERRMTDAFKAGAVESLKYHHRAFMPLHFNASNRARYSHEPRSDFYRWWKMKRHRSRTDLVRTGKTKAHITSRMDPPTTRGALGGKGVAATVTYRFPPSFRQAGSNPESSWAMKWVDRIRVTPKVMAREIAKVIPSEALAMNRVVHETYKKKMRDLLRGRVKWRNKYGQYFL